MLTLVSTRWVIIWEYKKLYLGGQWHLPAKSNVDISPISAYTRNGGWWVELLVNLIFVKNFLPWRKPAQHARGQRRTRQSTYTQADGHTNCLYFWYMFVHSLSLSSIEHFLSVKLKRIWEMQMIRTLYLGMGDESGIIFFLFKTG